MDEFIGGAQVIDVISRASRAEDLGVPKNRFHDEAFAFHKE